MTKREKAAAIFEELMQRLDNPIRLTKDYYLHEVINPNSNMVALIYYAFSILRDDSNVVLIKDKFKLSATPSELDDILCEYENLIWID